MIVETKVIWNDKLSFIGTGESDFTVPLDGEPSVGGENGGFKPMELIAIGLAGCTAMDTISLLKKKRQDVTAFQVHVHADSATGIPESIYSHNFKIYHRRS